MAEEEKRGVPPKATPGAPRPITVRLKPVVAKTDTQKTAEDHAKKASQSIPKSTVVAASSGPTARVPIPSLDDIGDKNLGAQTSPTVKLRPVKVPGAKSPVKPKADSGSSHLKPVTPAVPVSKDSHKPGSNPLPPGPKPPSSAQVQAAKSKTSRISLDAAIGVAPDGPMNGGAPKTIRLKRPAKLAGTGKMPTPATGPIETQKAKARTAPIGKTSRIPDDAIPKGNESATVTQKKTLKIRKKGAPVASAGDTTGASSDFEGLTPISDLNLAPVKQESSVFTAIAGIAAIAAVIVGILLFVCLGSHAVGPTAGRNSLATIKAGVDLPWPGAIAD